MNQIKAEIIADSINSVGNRCTSFVMTFPRIILAEVNTHCALARNSASSRAVPFEKMLRRVMDDPFIPSRWMKEHRGMQGNEYFEEELYRNSLQDNWLIARDNAIKQARYLSDSGLTKQIVNRLLEPFMWHTAIVTATEWENFTALRAHSAAEIHFNELAEKTLAALNEGTPKKLKNGEWHIPFGDMFDNERLGEFGTSDIDELKIKIATARCARVSYINFEGKDDYEADVALFENLKAMGHMSPMEHCAMADSYSDGKFKGFKQLRHFIPGENKSDSRLIRKKI